MKYCDDAISDILGDDWESFVCPLAGPGLSFCYVECGSEECLKCQQDFLNSYEKRQVKGGDLSPEDK